MTGNMTVEPSLKSKVDSIYEVTSDGIFGFFKEHRFLSNFHECPVWFEGHHYPSSENAYQASKVTNSHRDVLCKCSPSESKLIWKKLPKLYTEEQWNNVKFNIMYRVVTEKFLSNSVLLSKLKSTKELYLEETNWWGDRYWGVCNEKGSNHLGNILSHVRDSQFFEKNLEFPQDLLKLNIP